MMKGRKITHNDSAQGLYSESNTRRKLGILTHLQVPNETTSLVEGVVAI